MINDKINLFHFYKKVTKINNKSEAEINIKSVKGKIWFQVYHLKYFLVKLEKNTQNILILIS